MKNKNFFYKTMGFIEAKSIVWLVISIICSNLVKGKNFLSQINSATSESYYKKQFNKIGFYCFLYQIENKAD